MIIKYHEFSKYQILGLDVKKRVYSIKLKTLGKIETLKDGISTLEEANKHFKNYIEIIGGSTNE